MLLAVPTHRRSGARVGRVIVIPFLVAAAGSGAGWLVASSGDATIPVALLGMTVAVLVCLIGLALLQRSALGDAISLTRRTLGPLLRRR